MKCGTLVPPSLAALPPLTSAFMSLQTSSTGNAYPREGGFTALESATDVPHSKFAHDRNTSYSRFRFRPPFVALVSHTKRSNRQPMSVNVPSRLANVNVVPTVNRLANPWQAVLPCHTPGSLTITAPRTLNFGFRFLPPFVAAYMLCHMSWAV